MRTQRHGRRRLGRPRRLVRPRGPGQARYDGYLYLGPRLDGMINTGSYHVYPQEVRDAITALPYIRAALVRGEDDPV